MRAERPLVPRATYRLQLSGSFTFKDAIALVPYLAELGISHLYCSPYFRARPGSMHGYDVVDHNAINPEIGTREELESFVATLRAHGMGHILDFVPNHVGIMGADNAWWMDVLENGRASRYADFFDIDWFPPNPALAGKLLVPALGDPYGAILERGELQLRFEAETGSFAVFYHSHRFPIDPQTYSAVLERAIAQVSPESAAVPEPALAELQSLIASFGKLPDRESVSPEHVAERDRDKEIHKRRLATLLSAQPALANAVTAAVEALNGTAGEKATFDALHELLERQCYRLAYWRVASDDINYRRFFDVNDLAALCMENPQVFEATHRLVLELIAQGKLDGLRIDHPDGLFDPKQYFERLQSHIRAVKAGAASAVTADGGASAESAGVPTTPGNPPFYLVVEKILASFERLPASWPVHGTTGYNFANLINGVFVDGRAKMRLDRIYSSFITDYMDWVDVAFDSKVLVLRTALAAELNVLSNQLARIAQADRHTRDFTLNNLRQALTEVIACFPVYRTYVTESASDDDKRYIDWAIGRARRRGSAADGPLLDFVRAMLLADTSKIDPSIHAQVRAFAGKFQQVTAPVTAKGVEDSALYRFTRLASLNEVGSEPGLFGTSIKAFHSDAQQRAKCWPHEMLGTSTHDTKRAEDVRMRINVLTEMVSVWRSTIPRWSRVNRMRRRIVDDLPAPGPHAEYLLYQTLIGTWPLEPLDDAAYTVYRERIEEYMIKAAREAKRRTSWAFVNAEYEEALRQFIRLSLERREDNPFPAEIDTLARRMGRFGFLNSLSQTLCKLTAPGVPDIYQGNELWDGSLVDPDNRRPVDYELRRRLLAQVKDWRNPSAALGTLEDGRCKLYVTYKALSLRRAQAALFRDGSYIPLRVGGEYASHVLAYARKLGDQIAITIVPRLSARLMAARDGLPLGASVWEDTRIELPEGLMGDVDLGPSLENVLDGASVPLRQDEGAASVLAADLFASFPVSLLTRTGALP